VTLTFDLLIDRFMPLPREPREMAGIKTGTKHPVQQMDNGRTDERDERTDGPVENVTMSLLQWAVQSISDGGVKRRILQAIRCDLVIILKQSYLTMSRNN